MELDNGIQSKFTPGVGFAEKVTTENRVFHRIAHQPGLAVYMVCDRKANILKFITLQKVGENHVKEIFPVENGNILKAFSRVEAAIS